MVVKEEPLLTLKFLILSSINLVLAASADEIGCLVSPDEVLTPITSSPRRLILSSGDSIQEASTCFEVADRAERPV